MLCHYLRQLLGEATWVGAKIKVVMANSTYQKVFAERKRRVRDWWKRGRLCRRNFNW